MMVDYRLPSLIFSPPSPCTIIPLLRQLFRVQSHPRKIHSITGKDMKRVDLEHVYKNSLTTYIF